MSTTKFDMSDVESKFLMFFEVYYIKWSVIPVSVLYNYYVHTLISFELCRKFVPSATKGNMP